MTSLSKALTVAGFPRVLRVTAASSATLLLRCQSTARSNIVNEQLKMEELTLKLKPNSGERKGKTGLRKFIEIQGVQHPIDEHWTNIPETILGKVNNPKPPLHLRQDHPLAIIKSLIEDHLLSKAKKDSSSSSSTTPKLLSKYMVLDNISPVVSVWENFDSLLIPKDHPGRQTSDTYYVNKDLVLRTHTSAHQAQALRIAAESFALSTATSNIASIDEGSTIPFQSTNSSVNTSSSITATDRAATLKSSGKVSNSHSSSELPSPVYDSFILSADVYRRDEVDPTHYPVFHQMEGIRIFSKQDLEKLRIEFKDSKPEKENLNTISTSTEFEEGDGREPAKNPLQTCHSREDVYLVTRHLKRELEGMVRALFKNDDLKIRWNDDYFPFTSPSWEMEVFYNGKWLEVLGCGIVQQRILENSKIGNDRLGWAFGVGLERLAMVIFDIPDIRLFWSEDPRFLSQFKKSNQKIRKFVPFSKYPACYKDVSFWCPENYHENDFSEAVRDAGGDLVEQVTLIDTFQRRERISRCYRIIYRSMERTLENKEVDEIDARLRVVLESKLKLELR